MCLQSLTVVLSMSVVQHCPTGNGQRKGREMDTFCLSAHIAIESEVIVTQAFYSYDF